MTPHTQSKHLKDEEVRPVVAAAVRGDAQAKRLLVERTLPVVYGMLARLVGRRQELDDLVQNVYMRIFRSLVTFRGDATFTTWVCTICVNVANTYWRERKTAREVDVLPLQIINHESNAHDVAVAREGLRQVSAMLDAMSPTLRSAFVLHVLEGYDVESVATMTASSVGAAYKSIERARRHIEEAAATNPSLAQYLGESRGTP